MDSTAFSAGLGAILGVALMALAAFGIYAYRGSMGSPSVNLSSLSAWSDYLSFFSNFLPFALLTYGFAGDIINQEWRLSIPSWTVLISVMVIGLGTQWFAGSQEGINLSKQDTSGRLWCTIPGLEGFESPFFPTAFIVTSSIMFYYMYWFPRSGKSDMDRWKIVGWFLAIFALQVGTFIGGECHVAYVGEFPIAVYILLSFFVIGPIIAGIAYGSVANDSTKNPFAMPMGSPGGATGGMTCPDGGTVSFNSTGQPFCKHTGSISTCSDGSVPIDGKCPYRGGSAYGGHSEPVQGGDENTFVAELYKNGQLVTDSIAS